MPSLESARGSASRCGTPRSRRVLAIALVVTAAAAMCATTAEAHRPLLSSPVGGAPYSTYAAALQVPWVTSSWSAKRVADCEHPVFWMAFVAERSGQDVHVTLGVPAAKGLAGLRPGLALFGPGLPPYDAAKLEFPAPPARPGFGMLHAASPADQAACAFLENAESRRFYKPAEFGAPSGRRCAYYEPFSRAWLWITLDRNVTLPQAGGRYYLATFLGGRRSTGRYTVAVANWAEDEDFKRPYAQPAGNRQLAWYDAGAEAACCGGGAASGASGGAAGGLLAGCPKWSPTGGGG